jgi:hypothetical protein
MTIWQKGLQDELLQIYVLPHVLGGHGMAHVEGVLRLGEKALIHMPDVDLNEYLAVAWLHNYDRHLEVKRAMEYRDFNDEKRARLIREETERYVIARLKGSPFDQGARKRIVHSVLEHGKRHDDLSNDPEVLTVLRAADKVDRLTTLNILAGAAHRSNIPHYDPEMPFDYQHNKPNHLKYFLWNLENYVELPFNWARELVDRGYFHFFLNFLRELGRDIAERHDIPNGIEGEIKSALGEYYNDWAP